MVVLDADVLPLPGTLEAVASAAAGGHIVTGKVLRSDGRLDAVGGTVFNDGSTALIGAGSVDVNGPWHEFRRPVCIAVGIVAATAGVWSAVGPLAGPGDAESVREWCGTAWTSGRPVIYEPAVRVVRLTDGGALDAAVPASSPWARLSALRPARPPEFSDGAWRYVMAHDDVEACRG